MLFWFLVFSDEELDSLLDRSDLISGKSGPITSDDTSIQERQFKEYYGYTKIKEENNDTDEASSSAQIVEGDSSDAALEETPLRRSPMKSNSYPSKEETEVKSEAGISSIHLIISSSYGASFSQSTFLQFI